MSVLSSGIHAVRFSARRRRGRLCAAAMSAAALAGVRMPASASAGPVGEGPAASGLSSRNCVSFITGEKKEKKLDMCIFGDSALPGIVTAAGSQQTASINASVRAAHYALMAELLELVGGDSALAGLRADQVDSLNGGVAKIDEPDRHETYAAILAHAGRDEVAVEASAPPPQEMMNWSAQSYGAMFCEVKVNAVTGETRVSRFLGSLDCGRILSAKTAASQFRGAIIMGLGLALMEETQFDERSGRIMNPSLAEYHVPVHMDVPDIDVIWTDIPDPQTPMGAHGIGEIGITGTGAAIANAIFNATGRRIVTCRSRSTSCFDVVSARAQQTAPVPRRPEVA